MFIILMYLCICVYFYIHVSVAVTLYMCVRARINVGGISVPGLITVFYSSIQAQM